MDSAKQREERGEAREEREVKREERGISREDREVTREEFALSRDNYASERNAQAEARDERDIKGHTSLANARLQVKIVLGVTALFALGAFAFVILLFLPYAPMTVYSYEIKPRTACPNELLTTQVDYEIAEGVPVASGESQAVWTAVDVDGYDDGETLPGEVAPLLPVQFEPGRREIEGTILRPAPTAAGEWRFGAIITLHGRSVTQLQRLTPQEEETTTVLEPTSDACKGIS